jgi:hypothetical protein
MIDISTLASKDKEELYEVLKVLQLLVHNVKITAIGVTMSFEDTAVSVVCYAHFEHFVYDDHIFKYKAVYDDLSLESPTGVYSLEQMLKNAKWFELKVEKQ